MSSPHASSSNSAPHPDPAESPETQSRFCNWDYCTYSAATSQDIVKHWDEVHYPSLKSERVYAKRRKLSNGNWLVLGPEPRMADLKPKSIVKDEPPSQTTGDITTTTHTTDSYPIPSFASQLPASLPPLPTELLPSPQRPNPLVLPALLPENDDIHLKREGLESLTQDQEPISISDSPFIPPTQPFSQLPQGTPVEHSSGDVSMEEHSLVEEEVEGGVVKAVRARADSRVIGFGVAPRSSGSGGGGTPGRPRVSGDGVGFSWGGK